MAEKKFAEVIMNPVRQRIAQYLMVHEKGTAGEIGAELSDVPTASLYRHLKVLLEADCISVVEERKVRGTVEKTYGLVMQPMGDAPGKEDIAGLVEQSLFALMASFRRYFAREDTDPIKDCISVASSTLLLTDEEYMEMLGKIGNIINGYVLNKPEPGRKPRQFTIVSLPAGD